jgi:putative CocE/NonD family hydrolase
VRRAGAAVAALTLVAGLVGCSDRGAGAAQGWPPNTGAGPCQVTKQADVPARMRDGTVLKADVYRPATQAAVPVVLMRTQYGKAAAQIQPSRFRAPAWFASHCYLVVVQDIRGLGVSGGTFYEYANDADDGYDTVEWAATLPGSNGKVGLYGSSYVGATQWLAAIRTPPHLVTIVPANTSSDYYQNWTYEDGAFRLAFIEPWMMDTIALSAARQRGDLKTVDGLTEAVRNAARWQHYRPYVTFPPLRPEDPSAAPYFFDAIRHPTYDEYWKRWSIRGHYDQVTVPVLHFEGWYDAFLAGGLENFTGMVARGGSAAARAGQRIVIGPWDHIGWGRPDSIQAPMLKDIGPVGDSPINELMLAWFDHYLKGRPSSVSGPTVDYFMMGANQWRSTTAWPVPGTRFTRYYLGSGGHANTSAGDGTLAPQGSPQGPEATGPTDTYRYDPSDPVPSVGGHSCCAATSGPQGPYDQGPVEQRPDVLVYTTAPLAEQTEVTGPITVTLYAATSAPDTDFTAKLVALRPDGTALNLNNGIQNAQLRTSLERAEPVIPGRVNEYTIHVWPTSYLFPAGARIRLEISSSDFPQFAPNPNSGHPFGADTAWQPADQTIYHDPGHPSSVTLPIVPPDDPAVRTSANFGDG